MGSQSIHSQCKVKTTILGKINEKKNILTWIRFVVKYAILNLDFKPKTEKSHSQT